MSVDDEPVAEVQGINVHAKQRVDGRDRAQLEWPCRYITRPPVAQERLTTRPARRNFVVGEYGAQRQPNHLRQRSIPTGRREDLQPKVKARKGHDDSCESAKRDSCLSGDALDVTDSALVADRA